MLSILRIVLSGGVVAIFDVSFLALLEANFPWSS